MKKTDLDIIKRAGRNRHLIELIYKKKEREFPYIIEPYKLEDPYFYGRRIDVIGKKGTRKFILDKIVRARELEEPFKPLFPVEV